MYYRYRSTYKYNRSNFEKSKDTNGFKGWRKAQYAAQSGHCAWCYKIVAYKDMDTDHIQPLATSRYNHDLNNFDNLVLACHECNRDKKAASTYNEVAYKKTLDKLSIQQKHDGYAPKKLTWQRPSWIGANKYSHTYHDYTPVNIPESERNVWAQESPIVKDFSLKVDDIDYLKAVVTDKINDLSKSIFSFFR